MKVIFVDIDGPLLPGKMHLFRENRHNVAKAIPKFDEFSIRCFNLWAKYGEAKIVFSTYWEYYFDADELKNIMEKNGLGFEYHEDVITPKKRTSTRGHEIAWWLNDHPEVTHWIAVDDDTSCQSLEDLLPEEVSAKGRWIEVGYDDGLTLHNFYDGCVGLGIDQDTVKNNEFDQVTPDNHHTGGLWG